MDLKERRLKSFKAMKDMFMMYYFNAKMEEQNPEKKIAWITSGGPVEPLYAMDVIPIYPENHGALCGTAKMGPMLCESAEKLGFSPDICSYARTDFGQIETGESPVGGLPKPDFLVCCTNICSTVMKWYEELARIFKIPLIMVDTPFLYNGSTDHAMEYTQYQIGSYINRLEEICGKKMNPDRLLEVCEFSMEGVDAWKRILRLSRHKPAPMSCFDAFVHMAPIVTMRGTRQCLDYYATLEDELNERVSNNYGAIPDEKYRVLWDNLPIWYEMGFLSSFLSEHGVCMVADTYTNAWGDNEMELHDPIPGLAKAYMEVYLNFSLNHMVDKIVELAEIYDVDGVVMHSNRSCKPYSFGQHDMRRILQERLGKPAVMIEADMTDPRNYDRDGTVKRLETFIDMLSE